MDVRGDFSGLPHGTTTRTLIIKVKGLQRSGIEAIRTQIQPSKPKREITYITKSPNTKRTYGKPIKQLFPKREITGGLKHVLRRQPCPQSLEWYKHSVGCWARMIIL